MPEYLDIKQKRILNVFQEGPVKNICLIVPDVNVQEESHRECRIGVDEDS